MSTLGQWASLLALTAKWPEAAQTYSKIAAREETERGMTSAGKEDALAARFRAALSLLAQGDKPGAEKALQEALKSPIGPRTSPEMEARAFLTWITGKGAKLDLLSYQKSDERWASFVWRKEEVEEGEFEVRGRFSPAARAWRASLQAIQKKHPDCWAADYSLARVYAAGGFTEPSVQLLRKVTRARSDWWAPHFALGQRYVEKREKDAALEELRQVLKLAPDCRQAKVYVSLLNNLKDDEDE
jgi:tetratricopeptide (TPR) repeat protein